MVELLGCLIWLVGCFLNACYHALTDMRLGSFPPAAIMRMKWIDGREHLIKWSSLILLPAAVLFGQPQWYGFLGWLLLGYGFVWNATYYHLKWGDWLEVDSFFIPILWRFEDYRWEPSELSVILIYAFSFVSGAFLTLI